MKVAWRKLSIPEKIELVRELYGKDGASVSQMAYLISKATGVPVSRSAVAGFWHRNPQVNKLFPFTGVRTTAPAPVADRPKPRKPAIRQQPSRVHRSSSAPPVLVEEEIANPVVVPASRRVTLLEIGAFECRWSDDTSSPYLFCGHPVLRGSKFCAYHHRRVFLPAPASIKRTRN